MPTSIRLPSCSWPRLVGAGLSAALVAGVAGCAGRGEQFAPACPQTHILSDAADLTRFNGSGTDITDMVVDGRVTGGQLTCTRIDPDHLRAVLSVNMELTRGPAMQGRTTDVTYQVSASQGDNILDVERFPLHVTFDNNGSKLRITGEEVQMVLPTSGKVTGADYKVLIGFQLTPQELAFNRRRGPR